MTQGKVKALGGWASRFLYDGSDILVVSDSPSEVIGVLKKLSPKNDPIESKCGRVVVVSEGEFHEYGTQKSPIG